MVRVNLNFTDELCDKIDAYAKSNGLTRTAAVSVLCGQQLDFQEGIKAMSVLSMQYMSGQNKIDTPSANV